MGQIYISYSRKDQTAAQQLHDQLTEQGYAIFVDYASIRTGASWRDEITAAIRDADALIILISSAAIESKWIQEELAHALRVQKPIIPVLLERVVLPPELQDFQYIDATRDRNAAFEKIEQALDASLGVPMTRPSTAPPARRRRPWLLWLLLAAALILVALVALVVTSSVQQRMPVAMLAVVPGTPTLDRTALYANLGDTGVVVRGAQLHGAPDLSSVSRLLAPMTDVRIMGISEDNRWYEVSLPDGDRGWIDVRRVEIFRPASSVVDLTAIARTATTVTQVAAMPTDSETESIYLTATVVVRGATETQAARLTTTAQANTGAMATATPTRGLGNVELTATTIIQRATQTQAARLTATAAAEGIGRPSPTPEGVTVDIVAQTATALAAIIAPPPTAIPLFTPSFGAQGFQSNTTPTATISLGGAEPTIPILTVTRDALPDTGGGDLNAYIVAVVRTEVANLGIAPVNPAAQAARAEADAAGMMFGEAAVVQPVTPETTAPLTVQDVALMMNNQNNTLLLGMLASLGIGLLAGGAVVLVGRSRRPRRPHGHGQPGKLETPEPLLQAYQVFISCSDKDRDWIGMFVDDLEALDYLVWWYAKDAPGLAFGKEIRSAIYHTKVFVVVVSPDSMQSTHVEEEVRWAEIYKRPIITVTYRETPIEQWHYGLAKGAAISFVDEREYKGAIEQLTQAIDHYLQERLDILEAPADAGDADAPQP